MCGIVGFVSGSRTVNRELLVRQRDAMTHRGPDSAGDWVSEDGRVGFGHRRLAIIDLSPAGHQPMIDALTGNVVTFNGEIYNFLEVRKELEQLGERFFTHSDTEILLGAYRVWGADFVKRLDGMFAFALYDPSAQRVVIARDRAGEKPLYFRFSNGALQFSSELKGLLVDPGLARRIDASSLDEYLTYGYVSGDKCIVAGVNKLLPAHRLIFSLSTGEYAIDQYWKLPTIEPALAGHQPSKSERDALVGELDGLLQGAVGRQLVADVPVGILLSGGLDSSLVTAIAARQSATPVRTFTVSMKGSPQHDEAPYARVVAKHVGAMHTELLADPGAEDVLPALMHQFDEPFADSSMIPTYLVSRAIREHATVAVGGDGGDELFGGYLRHPVHMQQELMRQRVPGVLRSMAAAGAAVMPSSMRGRTYLTNLAGDIGSSVSTVGRLFDPVSRRALMAPLLTDHSSLGSSEEMRRDVAADQRTSLHRSTATDFLRYMPDDILVKVDRASMLTSLEVRAPLLDRQVIEFAFGRLPDALRAQPSGRKLILRELAKRYLPDELDVKRKQGFSIPLGDWLGTTWKSRITEMLSAKDSLLDLSTARALAGSVSTRSADADRLFALLAFDLWRREYKMI